VCEGIPVDGSGYGFHDERDFLSELKLRIIPLIKERILAEKEKFQKREREEKRRVQGLETEELEGLYIKGKSVKRKVSRTHKDNISIKKLKINKLH